MIGAVPTRISTGGGMIGKIDDYLRFNETALSLRAQRQELLASNIANADTPTYKARDIDFANALQAA
jgi:flagellar basal-body rod protein FlgB